jgi:hypothetical protein
VVFYLDADDVLLPDAVATVMPRFADSKVAKVSWPLRIVDASGKATGETLPPLKTPLPEGDLRGVVLQKGPDSYLSSPTSGNAWSRRFLEEVLPCPEENEYRQGADGYLITVAPLFGEIRAHREPLSLYRDHGANQFWSGSMEKRVRGSLVRYERRFLTLSRVVKERGWAAEVENWERGNAYLQWMRKADEMFRELKGIVGADQMVILVDEEQCGGAQALTDRRVLPFLEKDGRYWGMPADDAAAVSELERMRREGARFIAFAWPAFWWLDHYAGLKCRLEGSCVLHNERLKVFDLEKAVARG